MRKAAYRPIFLLMCSLMFMAVACTGGSEQKGYDAGKIHVPAGDPGFPKFGQYNSWVIDVSGKVSKQSIDRVNSIFDKLQDEKIAEVVIVVIDSVKHPDQWATNFGRSIGLGSAGLSTEGGNNGLVWLVRPDAQQRLTVSVGRGLPKLTSDHCYQIMLKAKEFINFNNFSRGAEVLAEETDRVLREIYKK